MANNGPEIGISHYSDPNVIQHGLAAVSLLHSQYAPNSEASQVITRRSFISFGVKIGARLDRPGISWRILARQYSDAREPDIWPEGHEPLGAQLVYHKGKEIDFFGGDHRYATEYPTLAARRRLYESRLSDLDYASLLDYLDALHLRTMQNNEAPFEEIIKQNIKTGTTAISTAMLALGFWCRFARDGMAFTERKLPDLDKA